MKFTVSGPNPDVLTRLIAAWLEFSDPPTILRVDYEDRPLRSDWLDHWLPKAERELWVKWDEDKLFWRSRNGGLLLKHPAFADDLPALARRVAELPIELAVFFTPFEAEWDAAGYRSPGFADGHLPHGWACLFKGAGHGRLVSRRWLEQRVWRTSRLADDVSLVEFHDPAASDGATALAQAQPGHERMGISKTGGFLQTPYVYYHQLDGVYFPEERTYKIPVAAREVASTEMLDLCALRQAKCADNQTPIEEAGFTFVMGPEEAEPYLEELWLRELGCWAVVDGKDVRLDTRPPLPAPAARWAM